MKIHESTENKITKDANEENVPQLEITEVVLVYCNIHESCMHFFLINHLANY